MADKGAGCVPVAIALVLMVLGSVFLFLSDMQHFDVETNPWWAIPGTICVGLGFLIILLVVISQLGESADEFTRKHKLGERGRTLKKRVGRWIDRKFPAEDSRPNDTNHK